MEKIALIHFGELFLKGKNKDWFIEKLIRNIKKTCGGKVIKDRTHLLLKGGDLNQLSFVSGISWWAKAYKITSDLDEVKKTLLSIISQNIPKTFKLEIKRSDKSFPLTSPEIAKQLGSYIEEKLKIKADFKTPEKIFYLEIHKSSTFLFEKKFKGLGGLPVSTSGKGLVLFSGGIDSPVAAHLMQKRGMYVDLIHFHTFPKAEPLKQTKIYQLAQVLSKYQNNKIRLFAAPYFPFQIKILECESNELVLFRRFMLKVAEEVANQQGAKALITGDSLGQVASQTLENLSNTNKAVSTLILRPLIGEDKERIIKIAKEIGTYSLSIKKYKDCCSIITRKAKTRTSLKKIEEVENKIKIQKIVKQTVNLVEEIKI